MLKRARFWLIIEAIILATHPFMMYVYWQVSNLQWKKQEQEYIARYGDDGGLMGDCSGVSVLAPFVILVYMMFFFIGTMIIQGLHKNISNTLQWIFMALIGALAVLPNLWLYYHLWTMYREL